MILNSPTVSGSLTVTGNTILSGSINVVGGLTGTASFATTAVSSSYSATATSSSYALASTSSSYALASTSSSYALAATTASYGLNALSSSNALTASSADTLYVRNNVTALGSITAQTLIVQTVTSSVLFTTGSNKIGSSLSNVQELTGSVGITGSLAINGTTAIVGSGTANYVPKFTASGTIGNSAITDDGTTVTLVSRALSGTSATFSNLITVSGFGNSTFSAGGTGYNKLTIRNTTAGTGNGAQLSIGTNADADQFYVQSFATTFTTSGMNIAGGAVVNGEGPGGLSIAATQSNIGFYTNGAVAANLRMTITSAGLVGIGTSSPSYTLHLKAASGITTGLRLESNGGLTNFDILSSEGDGNVYLYQRSNYGILIGTNNTERIRILSGGSVGIATSSPSYTLDVNGTFRASSTSYLGTTTYFSTGVSGAQNYGGSTIRIVGGTGTSAAGIQFGPVDTNTTGARGRIGFLACANNGNPKEFAIIKGVLDSTGANTCNGSLTFHTLNGDNGTEAATRMTIDGNGSIGAPSGANIYNASDIRLKKNISTVSTGLDSIMALNPVKFNWIDNFVPSENGKDILGFIAQEVLEVLPEAVEAFGENTITVDTTTVDNPLRVNEKYIIPVLVKAIQELKAEIDILKNR